MAELFQLDVVTPVRQIMSRSVVEVIAPGTSGEFGVLAGHTSFLTTLRPGRLLVKDPERDILLAISGGFAEVTGSKVIILAESAQYAEEIDAAEVQKEIDSAMEKIKTLAKDDPETAKWEKKLKVAELKLRVAEESKH